VAEKVIVDYQQSLEAMSDLSKKISLSKGTAIYFKGDLKLLCECLETEKICLSDKIQAIKTSLEQMHTASQTMKASRSSTRQ
jgi:hypothetical protein